MSFVEYVTLRLPFHVTSEEARLIYWTAWLCKLCAHRLLNVVKQNSLLTSIFQYNFIKFGRGLCYDIISNRRYIDGISTLIHSTLQSAKALKIDIAKLELRDWLLFQSEAEPGARGNLNIRFINYNNVKVLVYDTTKASRNITIRPVIPKGYSKLIKELVDKAFRKEIGYPARIYVKHYLDGINHLYGELQIMVKYDLYLEVMKRYGKPLGRNIAGVDVNTDRINLVVVDNDEEIVWMHTARFPQICSRGYRSKSAWSIIGEKIHEVLKHAYHHGASIVAVENPEVMGYLKYYWIRGGDRKSSNYNWKVNTFRNSIIERIIWKAPLYGLQTVTVDPKGTTHSKKHNEIMKRYRLDKHMASAYIIVLKAKRI